MDFEKIPLLRERPSRIFAFLLVYKDGKLEDGNIVNSYRITKFLYGAEKKDLQAVVITELKELARFGLIEKQEVIIKNRKNYIIRPNLDKFVDLFIKYFKLDFSEEEKQKFKEWFKSVDWKILAPINNDWQNYRIPTNIFEEIGLPLKFYASLYLAERGALERKGLKVTKEMFIENLRFMIEEKKGQSLVFPEFGINTPIEPRYDFLLQFLALPDSILKKISNIEVSRLRLYEFLLLYLYIILKHKIYEE